MNSRLQRVSRRVERAKQSFLQDHPVEARREHAFVLLEEIEASLDGSQESDHIRAELSGLRRDFKVEDDVTESVPDYTQFRDRLEKLTYAGRLATQESETAAFGSPATDIQHLQNAQVSPPISDVALPTDGAIQKEPVQSQQVEPLRKTT